jgi:hypothetical protein
MLTDETGRHVVVGTTTNGLDVTIVYDWGYGLWAAVCKRDGRELFCCRASSPAVAQDRMRAVLQSHGQGL